MARDEYDDSPWPAEDGGPRRTQVPRGREPRITADAAVCSKATLVATMVVTRGTNELYALCHSGGEGAVSWVERLDPITLETVARSEDLVAGPVWPGGLAAHANGSLYVVFGNHAHRLSSELELLATVTLPRVRPYNSFVVLADGSLVAKDFGGALAGQDPTTVGDDTELVVLSPELRVLSRCVLDEPSIARLSADGNDIYVVGTSALRRVRWDGTALTVDAFRGDYRVEGDGYGWDCVITDNSAFFLTNGIGANQYDGSLHGKGLASAPEAVVRVDLDSGDTQRFEINGELGGLVANPPAVDATRGIVVGYDSGNGIVTAWRYRPVPERLWSLRLEHAAHPIVLPEQGVVILADQANGGVEELVAVTVESGVEVCRVPTGSPVQSVLFPAVGFGDVIYTVSFLAITRIEFARS